MTMHLSAFTIFSPQNLGFPQYFWQVYASEEGYTDHVEECNAVCSRMNSWQSWAYLGGFPCSNPQMNSFLLLKLRTHKTTPKVIGTPFSKSNPSPKIFLHLLTIVSCWQLWNELISLWKYGIVRQSEYFVLQRQHLNREYYVV